ncbi:GNAT family N-acetyltransferase [Bordetella bronchialis]|uniref:N-acetyltransferase domain-containing protein n=1 Tax=Bordetella bronchialis TaxID=463025 RepID=A0ABM6CYM7_9BORD|nr:GNAT family N-acetyltransferase [Bordetella bronchialis]ANN69255.1 hypothetical protein BAU06_25740 [Bordetella bronchialis]
MRDLAVHSSSGQANLVSTPVDTQAIRMEEAALNATTVREQMLYDGWLVRWAPAAAKRARSVNVIAAPHRDLDEKLAFCSALYARAQLPPVFRLTSVCPDPALDAQLDARGLRRFGDSCVMAVPLRGRRAESRAVTLRYDHEPAARFAAIAGALRGQAAEHVSEHARRLAAIAVPCIRMAARDDDGRPVATGMVVVDGDVAGIFDVVVHADVRRRGYARHLMHRLTDEAYQAGARAAYLQVEHANAAARRLYASLGFSDRYAYWYRTHEHK